MTIMRTTLMRPILNFTLEIPFVLIHTELMNESFEARITRYIMLYWKIWKWQGDFRLYKTWEMQDDYPRFKNNISKEIEKIIKKDYPGFTGYMSTIGKDNKPVVVIHKTITQTELLK